MRRVSRSFSPYRTNQTGEAERAGYGQRSCADRGQALGEPQQRQCTPWGQCLEKIRHGPARHFPFSLACLCSFQVLVQLKYSSAAC